MEGNNYKVGVVSAAVVLAAIVGVVCVYVMTSANRYRVTINFSTITQVHRGTSVLKSGVQIGRVAYVKLLPDNQGVDLVLELDRDVNIRLGETCRIIVRSPQAHDLAVEFVQPNKSNLLSRFDGVAGAPKNNELEPAEYEFSNVAISDGDYINGGIVQIDSPNLFDTSGR